MKLAVLADIHGNLAALEAVAEDIARWHPDVVAVAGDIVNRGPRSPACWDLVAELAGRAGWHVIRGNHEDYVVDVWRDPSDRPGIEGAIRASVAWTVQQLGERSAWLAQLGELISLTAPDGGEARVVHASMRHNRDNILASTPDDILRQQIAPAPALIVVGHTHRPLVRHLDETLVVNVGSVGMPFDGDVRACYGRLWWRGGAWEAEIVRVPYDRERTARDFVESSFMERSGAMAPLVYDEFVTGWPRMFGYVERYRAAVLAGAVGIDESIRAYLAELGGGPPLEWR